jgi:hypothetical protein
LITAHGLQVEESNRLEWHMTTTRIARGFDWNGADELALDRLPGMPLLGFFTGTFLSLGIWGVVALIAWGVTA